MPDWTYVPLEPVASRVLGTRRTHRWALAILATLVRAGGRRWIPVMFAHPAVPDDLRGRLGARVPVSVARNAIDALPVQGASLIEVGPVGVDDAEATAAAAARRRCRVVAVCDSAESASAVAPYVDDTCVGDSGSTVLSDPDVGVAVAALASPGAVVIADHRLLVSAGPGWFHRVIEAAAGDTPPPDPVGPLGGPCSASGPGRAGCRHW
ncbi:hypothetical protein GCM10009722_10450 [Williamsia deligens]